MRRVANCILWILFLLVVGAVAWPVFCAIVFHNVRYELDLSKHLPTAKSEVVLTVWHFHEITNTQVFPIYVTVDGRKFQITLEGASLVVRNETDNVELDHFAIDKDEREHHGLIFMPRNRYGRSVEYYDRSR